ncbi:MAG: hypothetical protein FWF54_00400 [Candidatus Azobacteroides sp.]|nr:hypothetical protein [Candidatus Azobacteroides sp.]
MDTQQKEISKAFESVKFIWDNEKTDSYVRLNSLMRDTLELAINAQLKFNKNDFDNIFNNFLGSYWFGANTNGKGMGEHFYTLACNVDNISAARSYEAFYGFKPFISKKGNRLHTGSRLQSKDKCFRVTGFDFDTKRIHFVSYDISDRNEEGKRNLHSFDNKEWNGFRKQADEF